MPRLLFVCLGNICRSPTAAGVFAALAAKDGLAVEVESAGTLGHHAGDGADPRTVRHAHARGYDLSAHRARQLRAADFAAFDRILAMDEANLTELRRLCPPAHEGKLRLLLADTPDAGGREVPDPYDGGPEGFERVLDLVEAASRRLVAELRRS